MAIESQADGMMEEQSGFQAPRLPKDNWAARLYQKYGLGENPSLKEIEPIATKLLGNVSTAIEGAELMLGRRIDAKETELLSTIYFGGSAENMFGLLLMECAIDDSQNK